LNEGFLSSPSDSAREAWEKGGRDLAPNGSVMRTSVVGVIGITMEEEGCFRLAVEVGETTHWDPRCAVGVTIVSGLIRGLILGEVKGIKEVDELVERAWKWVKEKRGEELDEVEFKKHAFATQLKELELDDSMKMGYVYKCLGSSLFCLRKLISSDRKSLDSPSFESLITQLTMAGGDADTNACVAGALMGAVTGYSTLPDHWKFGMKHQEWLVGKVDDLALSLGIQDPSDEGRTYVFGFDRDTDEDGGKGLFGEKELKEREINLMEKLLLMDKARREEEEKRMEKEKKGRWSWISKGR
jgi:ADP-ribosylglycohydrolase